MIWYFTAHTINCRYSVFRVLGIYNFGLFLKHWSITNRRPPLLSVGSCIVYTIDSLNDSVAKSKYRKFQKKGWPYFKVLNPKIWRWDLMRDFILPLPPHYRFSATYISPSQGLHKFPSQQSSNGDEVDIEMLAQLISWSVNTQIVATV